MDQGSETIMGSLFSRMFRSTPAGAEAEAYRALSQSAADRLGPADDVNAFALVTEDRRDEARQIIRDMSPRDRALLSFHLEEVTRLVSEEEDFRRTADRHAARLSSEGTGRVSLEDIVEGHMRDI